MRQKKVRDFAQKRQVQGAATEFFTIVVGG